MRSIGRSEIASADQTRRGLGRLALGLLAVAALSGCIGPPPPGWQAADRSGALVYVPLGLHFPATFEDLKRLPPRDYDEAGDNTSIGYNSRARHLYLTFYIYPRSFGGVPDPAEHFKAVVGDVVRVTPSARLERAVSMPLPLGEGEYPGYNAFLRWAARGGEMGSFVLLIPRGERFFKVRLSFLMDGGGEPLKHAWEQSQRFLRSVEVPPLPTPAPGEESI